MALLKLERFAGIRPRIPDARLETHEASVAEHCDFAYGELRNTKDGFLLQTFSQTAKGLFTEDGLTFYSWDKEIDAVPSPTVKDSFGRMYYTGDGGMRSALTSGTRLNGGPPASSYQVGVPQPITAPVLLALPPLGLMPAGTTIEFRFHWEAGGIKYQETAIAPLSSSNDDASFGPPPVKAASTPATAMAVVRVIATKADGSILFDLYTNNSSYAASNGAYLLDIVRNPGTEESYTASLRMAIKEEDKETRAYVYTYVNTYGEEGPPSAPSIVTTSPVIDVQVTTQKISDGVYAPIKEIRIYRTPPGGGVADYFFVGAVSVLGVEPAPMVDNVKGEMLNEPISSAEFYPPDLGLTGLTLLPNGILMAWKGNEIHFSEPYKPWAWPPSYVKPLRHRIVGGIAHGGGAIVTTTVDSMLVSGVASDAMTVSKTNIEQGGVSRASMAVVDGYVIYASNDGLVIISGGSGTMIHSQRYFTREVWRSRYGNGLASMRFAAWDGRLVVFSGTSQFVPFMLRVDEADGSMTELPGWTAACAVVSPLSDQFYYANGTGLYQFNGGADKTATWQSAEIRLPKPLNFAAAQAECVGTWTVELWAREITAGSEVVAWAKKHTQTLASGLTDFRLPAGFESDTYRIRLAGSGRFHSLKLAQSFAEMGRA